MRFHPTTRYRYLPLPHNWGRAPLRGSNVRHTRDHASHEARKHAPSYSDRIPWLLCHSFRGAQHGSLVHVVRGREGCDVCAVMEVHGKSGGELCVRHLLTMVSCKEGDTCHKSCSIMCACAVGLACARMAGMDRGADASHGTHAASLPAIHAHFGRPIWRVQHLCACVRHRRLFVVIFRLPTSKARSLSGGSNQDASDEK